MLAVVLRCLLCNLTSKDPAFPCCTPDETGTRATNQGRWGVCHRRASIGDVTAINGAVEPLQLPTV